jgi:hypothetical protein
MTEEEARLYCSDKHKPTESPIMDLINEYEDKKGDVRYQCNYCEEETNSLGEFERHCYYEGADHRDITLNRIEKKAAEATNKLSAELQKHINDAIMTKKETARKQELAKQQAEQERLKKDLPLLK